MEKDTNPKDAIGRAKWRNYFTVPRQVLWALGIAMLEGALKYGRHNYRGAGVRASVYVDAAMGHIDQWVEGEDNDPDSEANLSHIIKAIASLTVLADAIMNDFLDDDRPPKVKDLSGLRDTLQEAANRLHNEHADKSPHHYSHLEDGEPYRGVDSLDTMDLEDSVIARFKGSTQYAEMLVEEQSRRFMREKSLQEMADAWSPELERQHAKEAEIATMMREAEESEGTILVLDKPGAVSQALVRALSKARLNGVSVRVGDVEKTDFTWDPSELIEDEIPFGNQEAVQHAASLLREPTQASIYDVDLLAHARCLDDPLYYPKDQLDVLGDDDPEEILFPDRGSKDWNQAHIVEGLTMAQIERVVDHEADVCGIDCDDVESSFAMLRRALLRYKTQPLRAVQLRWDNAYSDRSTRLTEDQWKIAQPDLVSVCDRPGASPFMPASFA